MQCVSIAGLVKTMQRPALFPLISFPPLAFLDSRKPQCFHASHLGVAGASQLRHSLAGGHFHSPVKAVQASREQRMLGACRPMVTVDAHFAWSLTPLYVSEKLPAVLTLMMALDL